MNIPAGASKTLILSCLAVKGHQIAAITIDYGQTWIPTVYGTPYVDQAQSSRHYALRVAKNLAGLSVQDVRRAGRFGRVR